ELAARHQQELAPFEAARNQLAAALAQLQKERLAPETAAFELAQQHYEEATVKRQEAEARAEAATGEAKTKAEAEARTLRQLEDHAELQVKPYTKALKTKLGELQKSDLAYAKLHTLSEEAATKLRSEESIRQAEIDKLKKAFNTISA